MSGGRLPMRLALLLMAAGSLAFALMLAGSGSSPWREDEHLVIDVITGGDGGRHAVVDRYTRAADRRTLVGVWMAQEAPPEKGSRRAPDGIPVAVWRGGFPRLAWEGARLRLIGTFERVRREDVPGCLLERLPAWDLCIDPGRVTLTVLP